MEPSDLINSGLGAVVGFALAQAVNITRLMGSWLTRPRLVIEKPGPNCVVLWHQVELENGDTCEESTYGFYVRNAGRRIATGVRFQLLQIEYRGTAWPKYAVAADHTSELKTYSHGSAAQGESEAIIVPGASKTIELAKWREDVDVVIPCISDVPDHYDELCGSAKVYKFTVVAFDANGHFVREVLEISAGRERKQAMGR